MPNCPTVQLLNCHCCTIASSRPFLGVRPRGDSPQGRFDRSRVHGSLVVMITNLTRMADMPRKKCHP